MSKVTANRNFTIVELTKGVHVRTLIPLENHSALRAGFAGYTANPRWGAAKFMAWKTGRQWRSALARNEMIVRSTDLMLVPALEQDSSSDEIPYSSLLESWSHEGFRLAATHA